VLTLIKHLSSFEQLGHKALNWLVTTLQQDPF